MTSTQDIATALVAHCRNGTEEEGLDTLYAPDALSVEAMVPPEMDPVTKGIEGIKGKHAWWNANFDVTEAKVEGPYLNGDAFTVIFEIDATEKATGQRMPMKEVALYTTSGGKIVKEEFFAMPMPG